MKNKKWAGPGWGSCAVFGQPTRGRTFARKEKTKKISYMRLFARDLPWTDSFAILFFNLPL